MKRPEAVGLVLAEHAVRLMARYPTIYRRALAVMAARHEVGPVRTDDLPRPSRSDIRRLTYADVDPNDRNALEMARRSVDRAWAQIRTPGWHSAIRKPRTKRKVVA